VLGLDLHERRKVLYLKTQLRASIERFIETVVGERPQDSIQPLQVMLYQCYSRC